MDRAVVEHRLRYAGSLAALFLVGAALLLAAHNWDALLTAWLPRGLPLRHYAAQPGPELASRVALLALAVAVLAWLVRRMVRRVRIVATPYLGLGGAQALGTAVAFMAYAVVLALVAWAMGIELTGLALPGALTGVVIGIAAQASLGNLINGLVILFTRPYVEGMAITARSPGLAGSEYSGTVLHVGLFYTIMRVGAREVRLPNSAMAQSTVIVRPEEVEVYVPVVLAPTTVYDEAIGALHRTLSEALPPRRSASLVLVLEKIDAAGYAVGVHASVATAAEERAFTAALARAVAGMIAATTPPGEQTDAGHPAADSAAPANATAALPHTAQPSTTGQAHP